MLHFILLVFAVQCSKWLFYYRN